MSTASNLQYMRMRRNGENPLNPVQAADEEGQATFQEQLQQCVEGVLVRQEQAQTAIQTTRERVGGFNSTQHTHDALTTIEARVAALRTEQQSLQACLSDTQERLLQHQQQMGTLRRGFASLQQQLNAVPSHHRGEGDILRAGNIGAQLISNTTRQGSDS